MTPAHQRRRMVFWGVFGIALFSALFSLAAGRGLWPELAPGVLHDTDLVAGLIGAVVALLALWLRSRGT